MRLTGAVLLAVGIFATQSAGLTRAGTGPDTASATSAAIANPFGAMLGMRQYEDRVDHAKELGATYYRGWDAPSLAEWDGERGWECDAARGAGLKVVLTVYNSRSNTVFPPRPSTPPADMDAYRQQLSRMLDAFRPDVLAVENEQDNPVFYVGDAPAYLDELAAACAVAHQRGIPCTDGGLLSSTVTAMVYQDFVDRGLSAEAAAFAERAAPTPADLEAFYERVGRGEIERRAASGREFLAGYRGTGADYVDFHWYLKDGTDLRQAIDYLERETGLPAVTNEIGQRLPDSPVTTDLMNAVVQEDLRFAIWFSLDRFTRDGQQIVYALHDSDGRLRPTGVAFQQFIADLGNPRPEPGGDPDPGAATSGPPAAPFAPPSWSASVSVDLVAPAIARLSMTHRRFSIGRRMRERRTPAAWRPARTVTTFRYSLSEAARVSIRIESRRGSRAGSLRATASAGANRLAFDGRLHGEALRPSRYVATVVARDAAGNLSRRLRIGFKIVPP